MNQTNANVQEAWLKVLGKGMITLPKKWREDMNVTTGDVIRAKKEGAKVVIEARQSRNVPYRVYSDSEIDEFIKADKLPKRLAAKVKENLISLSDQ